MKNTVKILGTYGSKTSKMGMTSIQVSKHIAVDAGNIISSLGNDAFHINHIFLTHSHLDHIVDIPFLIDSFFSKREIPLKIYALKGTIENLKNSIFNWDIWPDFSKIKLDIGEIESIEFIELQIGETINIEDCSIKPIENNHTDCSCGYIIKKNDNSILLTSDTYTSSSIWEEVNKDETINSIMIDVSFPSKLDNLAKESKHLTPKILEKELENLQRDNVKIFINHVKPLYLNEIKQELLKIDPVRYSISLLEDGDLINLDNGEIYHEIAQKNYIEHLYDIGYSLTTEKNLDVLMQKLLGSAKTLTNADAGTFYLMSNDEKSLKFASVQTDSLNINMGGEDNPIPWPDLNLYNKDGTKNNINVSVYSALNDTLINIPDVYESSNFEFQGPRSFDEATGYRTKSMLVIPMKNHEDEVIGVLQLINKKNECGETISFLPDDEKIILSMSSMAAVIVTNAKLLHDLERLLDSFIQSIATAIGEKSKYTGGHINRVAELTVMMAEAINEETDGIYQNHFFNKKQMYELGVAAWMHDIGKITTPEYVIDKARKLETIYDRINEIESRFEVLKRDKQIKYLEQSLLSKTEQEHEQLDKDYKLLLEEIDNDLEFLKKVNIGSDFMSDEDIHRINNIAKQTVKIGGNEINLLSDNEIENLSIRKGTLTEQERFVINNHAKISYDILSKMPFPKNLKNVAEIASGHHEKICGGGYPLGLKGDEICFESRILAIADIFEALTAHDRPYKEPNTLNQSLRILYFMAKDKELDPQLVKFFVDKKLYLKYAKDNLVESQLDKVTVDFSKLD